MKLCYRCGAAPRTGSIAYCRPCSTLKMREWRAENPERNSEIAKRSDKKRYSSNVAKYTVLRRERQMRWARANPEAYRKPALKKYHDTRTAAIAKLGNRCACCGETLRTMLQIDHIRDDGYIERAGRKSFSTRIARKVMSMNDPFSMYQCLCANCNHSKARNHGTCEHKIALRLVIGGLSA